MGMGQTVTIGFIGPEGRWVPVSAKNPLPIDTGAIVTPSIPSENLTPSEDLLPKETN